jgi:hypothetical protein
MASLPLSVADDPAHPLVMAALGIALFFLLITVASMTGRTTDTRDSADWKPTNDGTRSTT